MKSGGIFEPFGDETKVSYPLDAWFNDEFLVFEIPILDGKKEDIQITKTSDLLKIKYTRSNKEDDSKRTWIKRGVIKRDFNLEWRITSKFDYTEIQSVFENGLLTIYVPFAKEAKPEPVQILDTGGNWKKIALGEKLEGDGPSVKIDANEFRKTMEKYEDLPPITGVKTNG